MEIDIKCVRCGKATRYFNLGRIYYEIENPSQRVAVENSIICPKCKEDISRGQCLVKLHYFMMSLLTANMALKIEEEGGEPIPII
ncbi:hypothetical protein HYX18_02140 [Candidatus Woesearchaeota archaeon]|nr:hypothetical protein [Candidatus Woesearchaeota archaeon]